MHCTVGTQIQEQLNEFIMRWAAESILATKLCFPVWWWWWMKSRLLSPHQSDWKKAVFPGLKCSHQVCVKNGLWRAIYIQAVLTGTLFNFYFIFFWLSFTIFSQQRRSNTECDLLYLQLRDSKTRQKACDHTSHLQKVYHRLSLHKQAVMPLPFKCPTYNGCCLQQALCIAHYLDIPLLHHQPFYVGIRKIDGPAKLATPYEQLVACSNPSMVAFNFSPIQLLPEGWIKSVCLLSLRNTCV